jgi:hypothetical protein
MTIVSTKEFNTNQEKYFDMALNDHVYIQRGDCMFIVMKVTEPTRKYKEPDEDLRRAITMDEFLIGAKEDLREIFKKGKR